MKRDLCKIGATKDAGGARHERVNMKGIIRDIAGSAERVVRARGLLNR